MGNLVFLAAVRRDVSGKKLLPAHPAYLAVDANLTGLYGKLGLPARNRRAAQLQKCI